MKSILDFLTLPLSLPISPIWDFVICFAIGEIAYRVAFSFAGEYGSTRGERTALHWLFRIPFWFLLWCLACAVIKAVYFISANWIWMLVALGVLALAGIFILLLRNRQKGAY